MTKRVIKGKQKTDFQVVNRSILRHFIIFLYCYSGLQLALIMFISCRPQVRKSVKEKNCTREARTQPDNCEIAIAWSMECKTLNMNVFHNTIHTNMKVLISNFPPQVCLLKGLFYTAISEMWRRSENMLSKSRSSELQQANILTNSVKTFLPVIWKSDKGPFWQKK